MSTPAFRDPFKDALAKHLPEHHEGAWYPRGPLPNWSTSTITVYLHGEHAFTFMIHDSVTPEALRGIGKALIESTMNGCPLCNDTGSIDVWGFPMSVACNCAPTSGDGGEDGGEG